jgi:hypothetical protein
MSKKGGRHGNNPIENFFSLAKKEIFCCHEWEFKAYRGLRKAVDSYIP